MLCRVDLVCLFSGAARDLVKSKGLYANANVVPDSQHTVKAEELLDGRFMILGAGTKKRVVLVAEQE